MGLYSNAELIWGCPILGYDEETGEPTRWWNEDEEDWIEVPEPLSISTFGHYEDPDNQRAILTTKAIKEFRADCWTPEPIGKWDFNVEDYQPGDIDDFVSAVVAFDAEEVLNGQGWYLVASFG